MSQSHEGWQLSRLLHSDGKLQPEGSRFKMSYEQRFLMWCAHDVIDSPHPTLLDLYGKDLSANDVVRIDREAREMLQMVDDRFVIYDRRHVAVMGRLETSTYAGFMEATTEMPQRAMLRRHLYYQFSWQQEPFAVIVLYLPKKPPWMLYWTGQGRPPGIETLPK